MFAVVVCCLGAITQAWLAVPRDPGEAPSASPGTGNPLRRSFSFLSRSSRPLGLPAAPATPLRSVRRAAAVPGLLGCPGDPTSTWTAPSRVSWAISEGALRCGHGAERVRGVQCVRGSWRANETRCVRGTRCYACVYDPQCPRLCMTSDIFWAVVVIPGVSMVWV